MDVGFVGSSVFTWAVALSLLTGLALVMGLPPLLGPVPSGLGKLG